MSKIIKFILIIIVILAGIFLIERVFSYLGKQSLGDTGLGMDRIQQLLQEKGIYPVLDIPKIESIDPEEEGQDHKEFVSPDGKLKLNYPSNWLKVEGEDLNNLREKAESHGLEFLFLAQSLDLGEFGQILIHEGFFDSQEGFEQIIEKMKEVNQEQGWDTQILNLEIEDKEAVFEAEYQKADRYSMYSKEKIVIIETTEAKKKVGLIAFITFDKDWLSFKEQADFVIDSVTINE